MKRAIAAAAALAASASLAVPAIASASPSASYVASAVQRQYSTQVRNRAALSGIGVSSITVRCAADGGYTYTCYATYVAYVRGVHAKYGIYIDVSGSNLRWHTVGTAATLLSEW
jgi:hypothetical protein